MRQRLLRHLRSLFQLQPGSPALSLGIRAAVAVTVPFSIVSALGFKSAGWTGLTGLLVTLVDRGGSYRGRARLMSALALLGAAAGTLGALAGDVLWLDAMLLFFGVVAATFFRCYGDDAGSVGDKVAVIFVASLGAIAVPLPGAIERGGALLFGGLWAMLQALVLWPLHPYRPARKAISSLYWGIAEAADDLALHARAAASPERWEEATNEHAYLRRNIERAREALAAVRVGQGSEARRFEHLLVMLEQADPLLATLSALGEAMETASADPGLAPARREVASASERFARLARAVAIAVQTPDLRRRERRRAARRGGALKTPELRLQQSPPSVSELVDRLWLHAGSAADAAWAMCRGHPVPRRVRRVPLPRDERQREPLRPILENLRPGSLILRHAARAGIVATVAVVITTQLGLRQSHWVVLAAIGILQPYSVSTEQIALHRVGGTLLGGTLAAVLSGVVQTQGQLLLIIGLLTALSVSLLPLNFGAFQMLLTPDFLLLASLHWGDWSIAGDRAIGVLIACGLALLGVWILWPMPERRLFPDAAAAVLRADCRYLRKVATLRSVTEPEVGEARRELGLALLDAEASFQRLVTEYRGPAHRLEPAMALLTYSRRFAGAVTALGEQPPVPATSELLGEVVDDACGALDALAHSLEEGHEPPPVPNLPLRPTPEDPVTEALIHRVPRQLGVLRGAVEKLTVERALDAGPVRLVRR